jgi:sugar fermentation stimulation protein A
VTPVSHPIGGPLVPARFLHRYNRFLLQVRLDLTGELADAHMADPGRLRELLVRDKRLWLRAASGPHRKTRWTAVLVESRSGRELVSLDTTLPNRLVRKALQEGAMEEFHGWTLEKAEVTLGRSRLDFLLSRGEGRRLALEVKSVTLVDDGVGLFPDAVTVRGARHVRELADIAGRPGWEAAVLFVLQRSEGGSIRAARAIDPGFADALEEAKAAGVRVLGRRCRVYQDRVELGPSVPADAG